MVSLRACLFISLDHLSVLPQPSFFSQGWGCTVPDVSYRGDLGCESGRGQPTTFLRTGLFFLVLTGSSHISSILGCSPSNYLTTLAQGCGILRSLLQARCSLECSVPSNKSGLLRDKGRTTYMHGHGRGSLGCSWPTCCSRVNTRSIFQVVRPG